MFPRPENEHLSAWLDGELDEAEAAELEAELVRDPELRAELASLESVVRLVRSEGPAPAPAGFHQRVMARVEEEHPARPSWWSRLRRPGGIPLEGWVLGLAAAAALLLVLPIRSGDPEAPALRELSPAAVELPRAPVVAQPAATEGGQKGALPVPSSKVIGRATTGGDSIPRLPAGGGGAASVAPVEETIASAEGTIAPPEGTAEPGTAAPGTAAPGTGGSAEGDVRYVVRSEDAGMKREILALAGRYGAGATSVGAEPVTDGRMRSGTEELVVRLAHTDLAAFARDLAAGGYTVEALAPEDTLLGGTVEVRITLQLVGGAPAAAPAVPNASRMQRELDAESVGEAR